MNKVFYVCTDPAPDGALKAFDDGDLLIDTTGRGHLNRFIIQQQLTGRGGVLGGKSTIRQVEVEREGRDIVSIKRA